MFSGLVSGSGTKQLCSFWGGGCRSSPTLPPSIQDLGETLMQLWMEINVVIFQKLIKVMPQQMCVVVKAKCSPMCDKCLLTVESGFKTWKENWKEKKKHCPVTQVKHFIILNIGVFYRADPNHLPSFHGLGSVSVFLSQSCCVVCSNDSTGALCHLT